MTIKHNYILTILIMLLCTFTATAQKIALKNNLLLDGAMAPNLGLEVVTGERTSIGVDVAGAYHPWWGKDSKTLFVQPEMRYWFNGRPLTRQFVGLVGIAEHHYFKFGHEIQNGNALGIGLSMGYDMSISKRLVVDFHGSFGAIFYRQRQYYTTNRGEDNPDDWYADGGRHNNANGYILAPLKVGISISYILK